ncbi:hypothetical protein BDZ89DRAFT_1121347 [Hymenopellis radicata]|nr:hypothetical protein BDZ89DRAFT_1121347 [Hymenopellis radicata]
MWSAADNKSGRIMLVDEPPTYDEVGSGQLTSSPMCPSFLSPCLGLRGERRSEEVKRTVTALIHDIVQPVQSGVDSREQLSLDIVSHCARACVAHSIDFGVIIQRPSMEKHSPLYWAVVNGRDDSLVGPREFSGKPSVLAGVAGRGVAGLTPVLAVVTL